MPSEMVERVARAICKTQCVLQPHECAASARCVSDFEVEARAAIEAMREPTRNMLACADFNTPNGFHWTRKLGDDVVDGVKWIWSAMIVEALTERKP
jgi:hypothetical protein